MKKYRIVKTESGDYKIQKSILFGLFWAFAKEPIASYNEYRHGYEFDENDLFRYNSVADARKAVSFMKRKKRVIYRGYVIRLMKTDSYNLLRNYEYRYFVKPRFDEVYKSIFSFTSFNDAISYIDGEYKDTEDYNKRYKVKEIVKYC